MRHVTLVSVLVLILALGPAVSAATWTQEDPILKILEDPLKLGPYADPNG
jgi:hypothetical protein